MNMETRKVLEYLEDLALKLGVEIVYEKLESKNFLAAGGLCKVKGAYKIFIDPSETIERRIQILAGALSSFDREEIYILPYIREILEKAKELRKP
jgi:hypothetical protein